MYRSACTLIFFLQLLMMSAASSWWLLGVEEISKSQIEVDCGSLNRSLATTRELDFCQQNKTLVQMIAVGNRRGILECQATFAGSRWNCTTFHGDDLFGKFINDGTRETGVINAMLAASAGREIAIACSDEKLGYCTCKTDGINGYDGDEYKTYGCDHDPYVAKNLMNDFFNDNERLDESTSVTRRIEIHNHNTGLRILTERKASCRCIGLSGSCAVQKCLFATPDLEEMGENCKTKYDSAVQVELDSTKTALVSVNGLVSFDDDNIIHVTASPSFCLSDASQGIVGTENRQCDNPASAGSNACSVLCCDRGYYQIELQEQVEECEFVWCCRVECITTTVSTYQNYCKPSS